MDRIMAKVEPMDIRANVLIPAICPLRLRSNPTIQPNIRLMNILNTEETVVTSVELSCSMKSVKFICTIRVWGVALFL